MSNELSILTAPEGAVQWRDALALSVIAMNLSILTAPEGAVQSHSFSKPTVRRRLSILTAPEGAVQFRTPHQILSLKTFQSSPPPKERCNSLV